MYTCKNCNRQISIAKRISDNGIKYLCSSDEDVKKCLEIMREKEQQHFDEEQLKLSKIDGIHKCNYCNKYFLHFSITETYPERYSCPFCNLYFFL